MFKKVVIASLAALSFAGLSARGTQIESNFKSTKIRSEGEGKIVSAKPEINEHPKVVLARKGDFIVRFHTNDKEQPNRDQATAGTSTRMGYDGRLEGLTIEAAKVTNGVAEESNEANLELVAGKDDALLNRIHSARTFEIRMHNNMITVHPLN